MVETFHPSSKVSILKIALAAAVFVLLLFFTVPFIGPVAFLIMLAVGIVAVLAAFSTHMAHQFKTVEIGDNTLTIRIGVLQLRSIVIPYEKITHLRTSHTLLQRTLNLGSLEIDTAGTPEPEVAVADIPQHHLESIVQKIEEHSKCRVEARG